MGRKRRPKSTLLLNVPKENLQSDEERERQAIIKEKANYDGAIIGD